LKHLSSKREKKLTKELESSGERTLVEISFQ